MSKKEKQLRRVIKEEVSSFMKKQGPLYEMVKTKADIKKIFGNSVDEIEYKDESFILQGDLDKIKSIASKKNLNIEPIEHWGIRVWKESVNESNDALDDYSYNLTQHIANKYKDVLGWNTSVDMSGALELSKKDNPVIIYATPYWNGNLKLPVDVSNNDAGEQLFDFELSLKQPSYDMDTDSEMWFNKITKVIDKLKLDKTLNTESVDSTDEMRSIYHHIALNGLLDSGEPTDNEEAQRIASDVRDFVKKIKPIVNKIQNSTEFEHLRHILSMDDWFRGGYAEISNGNVFDWLMTQK